MEILKDEDVRAMMNDEVVQMKLGNVELGTEWEMFKENIRPLKRGRNISMLNRSLKAQTDPKFKSQLIQIRRYLYIYFYFLVRNSAVPMFMKFPLE